MDEKQKEYLRSIVWEILSELEYSDRLTQLENETDTSYGSLRSDITELRHNIDDVSFRLSEIEKSINEIKESFMYDNLLDLSVVFNKRLAEINTKLSEISNRI